MRRATALRTTHPGPTSQVDDTRFGQRSGCADNNQKEQYDEFIYNMHAVAEAVGDDRGWSVGQKSPAAATIDQARATKTPHKRLERTLPAGGRPCRSGAGPTTTHDPTRFSSAVCLPAPAQAVVPPKGVN